MNCRVCHAGAEAKGSHLGWVQNPLLNAVQDSLSSDVVARVDALELGSDVPPSLERHASEVGPVVNAEVVEWREQSLIERLPQTHVAGDPVVEPMNDVLTVRPFRSRGQTQEHLRLEPFEQLPICRRLRVVKLIDDDNVVRIDRDVIDRSMQGLDRGKDVFADGWALRPDVPLAERHLVQDVAEDLLALLQDLVAMRHEQQALEPLASKALVVERRHPGLARAGWSHHEVAHVAALALGSECLEHFLLERLRANSIEMLNASAEELVPFC